MVKVKDDGELAKTSTKGIRGICLKRRHTWLMVEDSSATGAGTQHITQHEDQW